MIAAEAEQDIIRAHNLQADSYIVKSFDVDQFIHDPELLDACLKLFTEKGFAFQ